MATAGQRGVGADTDVAMDPLGQALPKVAVDAEFEALVGGDAKTKHPRAD
jgi:hypothetical protein